MQRDDLRWSLSTYSLRIAAPLALEIAVGIKRVFDLAELQSLTADEIITMARACFDRLFREIDDAPPTSFEDADRELSFQNFIADERIAELEGLVGTDAVDAQAAALALEELKGQGLSLADLDPVSRAKLLNGISRALIEQQKLLKFRLTDGLMPYLPVDPLFKIGGIELANRSLNAPGSPAPADESGPRLEAAVEEYLRFGAKHWRSKTVTDWRAKLGMFVTMAGPSRKIATITATDIRGFRDRLCELHRKHRQIPGDTWLDKLTPNEQHRIARKTASNIFDATKRFFRWAYDQQGYLDHNPAENVRLKVPATDGSLSKRRPFTQEELMKLFSAPVFHGYKSIHRKHLPGSLKPKDAYFWLPVLGYATGARLGELVQLHIDDVVLDTDVPYLRITAENSGPRNSDTVKQLKSDAAVRDIPLDKSVLALGFDKFVLDRAKKSSSKPKRLFREIKLGPDGQASTTFSKWFARYLDRIGIDASGVVFHSFRHLMEDMLRNALLPQYVIDRIIGHQGKATSDGYGEGVTLDVKAEAIAQISWPVVLTETIGQ